MTTPKVSICIPTYNSGRFLREMLDSISTQSYSNIEIIISDNASKDDTVDIANEYCEKYGWRIFRNKINIGAVQNFNNLIEYSSGDYIAIYHADDVYNLDIIQKSVDLLNMNSSLGLVSTLGCQINEKGEMKSIYKLPKSLVGKYKFSFDDVFTSILKNEGLFLITPSVMVRKEAYNTVGVFDTSGRYLSAADYEMWFRLMQKYDIGIINENLIQYRTHLGQGTQAEIRDNFDIPDSLKLYQKYSSKNPNKYLSLYNYILYRLLRVLAIRYNNVSNFDESDRIVKIVCDNAPFYKSRLLWLKVANKLKIKIRLNYLICAKNLIFRGKVSC